MKKKTHACQLLKLARVKHSSYHIPSYAKNALHNFGKEMISRYSYTAGPLINKNIIYLYRATARKLAFE